MYVLLCIHVSCTPHILFTLQIPTRARSVNPFSLQDEVRMILEPRSCPQSQDPRSIYLPLQLAQVKFHSGKWKCSRESWVVTRHQIYLYIYIWISAEKIQDQQNSSTHFVRWSSARKKISRNPRSKHWISRSPLHKTRRWVPPRHGSEYKAPRTKKTAEVRY